MPNSLSHVSFPDLTEIVGTHYSSMLDSLDGWQQLTNGGGAINFPGTYAQLIGGGTPGSYALLQKLLDFTPQDFSFGAKTILRMRAYVGVDADDDDLTLLGVGDIDFGASNFGLRFKSTKVQAFCGNGTDQSNIDLFTDLEPPWSNTYLIKIILFPGVRLEFWIDGVLVGTKSNHLPLITDFFTAILSLRAAYADGIGAFLTFSAFDFYTIP